MSTTNARPGGDALRSALREGGGALPLRLGYEATTLSGRAVIVHAEYDPGWSDTVGPVAAYARVQRVRDAQTHALLVDNGLVDEDPVDGLALAEVEDLEARALEACETALLSGRGFRH